MTTHPPLWLEANRAWVADHVHRLFAPLRAHVGMDNPLAIGAFCAVCGTRLDKEGRECPMCGGGAR